MLSGQSALPSPEGQLGYRSWESGKILKNLKAGALSQLGFKYLDIHEWSAQIEENGHRWHSFRLEP